MILGVDVVCKSKAFGAFRLSSGTITPEKSAISPEKWCIQFIKVVHSGSGVLHSGNCEFSIYFHSKQEIIDFEC